MEFTDEELYSLMDRVEAAQQVTDEALHALMDRLESAQEVNVSDEALYAMMDTFEAMNVSEQVERVFEHIKPEPSVPGLTLKRIMLLMKYALKQRLRNPRIRFRIDGKNYQLLWAGKDSSMPGTVNVVREDQTWMGRIHKDGTFHPSRRISSHVSDRVSDALFEFDHDPEMLARAYGQRTGRCCFCHLPLRDERSVAAGYGAICASNYGLMYPK